MSDILVIYKSKYGATEKYANMLKADLDCDIIDAGSFNKSMLAEHDRIILAGGIYASGIAGIDILKQNIGGMTGKKLAVFCVGASPFDEKAIEEVKSRNMKGELQRVPLFYGRGAWDESKMSFKDRTMCKMLQKMVAKKDPSEYEPWMTALMSAIGKSCDWTDRKYLEPLMEYMKAE